MIGLDTNILVRYFAQDDQAQSAKATALIERRLTEDEPGFVSIVTLVETVWVLERSYAMSKEDLAAVIRHVLQVDVLVVESEAEVFAAVAVLQDGDGSLADALIGLLGAKAGCTRTMTFDTGTRRLPWFELL